MIKPPQTLTSLLIILHGRKPKSPKIITDVAFGNNLRVSRSRVCCRISYCSADATHDHVFAFIATNLNETMECHAFLCPKRKMAQTVTLTVAQAFNTAYQVWQLSQSDPRIHHTQDKSPPLTGDRIGEGLLLYLSVANAPSRIQS